MSWWSSRGPISARAFAVLPRNAQPSYLPFDALAAPIRRAPWALEPQNETEKHAERVAVLAVQIGAGLNLGDNELAMLRRGAQLHDVGKHLLPSPLLHKSGPLTKTEWAQMQRHPQLGREWARERGVRDRDILNIILHHHERWDGQGYPMGLAGEAIPLGARIVALCDVFDALMSERRYKSAWSLDRTLTHIAEHGGTQFDPELTQLFVGKIMTAV